LTPLGSSPGFLEKLIGVFYRDNTALVGRMEQAVRGTQLPRVQVPPARDEGLVGQYGTDRLTKVCANLGKLSDAELTAPGARTDALHRRRAQRRE